MTLDQLNHLPADQLKNELAKCCGATSWVNKMAAEFPVNSINNLLQIAQAKWQECTKADWLEAFDHHPQIGDVKSLEEKFASTAKWAAGEQSSVQQSPHKTIEALAKANADYKAKFGYIFIVCATGKSAEEMLDILQTRLFNHPTEEIKIAAAEQDKITALRLKKLVEK